MRNPEGDWKSIIQAQAQTNKLLQDQETQLSKLGRKLYKKELDTQLTYKNQMINSLKEEHSHEREFLRAQHLALHDFETSKKQEDKSIQRILAKDYEAESSNRVRRQREEREHEKSEEQIRINQEFQRLQAEKESQVTQKAKQIRIQQQSLQQNILEKQSKRALEMREKERDKRMIHENMMKQAASENNFREFYQNRQAQQEEKMKTFQPVLRNEQAKWEAINRSNAEYVKKRERELSLK